MAGSIDFSHARTPPGLRLYAVGDLHGRLDLLRALHRHVDMELQADAPTDWRIVYLGDYVDRGPDSRGVLEFLAEAKARDPRHVVLAGNHDLGLLDFLARPDPCGIFITHGGLETAASYDVHAAHFGAVEEGGDALRAFHAAVATAIPQSHLALLHALEASFDCGDFFCCHAGIRPGVALERQSVDDLVWIRGEFHRHEGLYPKVILHGHTPSGKVTVRPNRVNLDTGACRTGRLSVLRVEDARKTILTVRQEGVFQSSAAVTP